MAEQILLCAENLFNLAQFPGHTVSAEEEASGYEAYHVGRSERSTAFRWQPTTSNSDTWVQVTCDVVRAATFFAVDRGTNHKGYRWALRGSDDSFTTYRSICDVNTIPLVAGGVMSGAMGCVTSEGAWLKTFTADGHNAWRVHITAMGSGLLPQVTGLYLGRAWTPSAGVTRYPLEDEGVSVQFEETTSPFGWSGRGRVARNREGNVVIRFPTVAEEAGDEALLRYHLDLYERGNPMWLCWRSTDAPWKAMLVHCPNGQRVGLTMSEDWVLRRQVVIPFREESPA